MNLVYITDSKVNPLAGGIARITYRIAEALRTKFGYHVYFYYGQEIFVDFIRKIGNCILIVQSPCKLARVVFSSKIAMPKVHIVTVFHGTPGFELVPLKVQVILYRLIHKIDVHWTFKQLFLQFWMALLPKSCFYRLLRSKYALPYGNCEKIVVLSPRIIDQYQLIAPGYREAFVSIPNALSFDLLETPITKAKEVLVVARLDDWHKRISEILKIWEVVQQDRQYHDWILRIVGDGIDKPYYEEYVRKHTITNIAFEGLQNPLPYYQKASIFLMTSACEGLPMTILEALQCGCIPIIYDSFASAKDIVCNDENGFLVTPNDRLTFVKRLKALMEDADLRKHMASNCIASTNRFSLEKIATEWNELIKSL